MPWALIGKYALQFAVWCLQNPLKVDLGLKEIHDAVNALHFKGKS